MPYRSRLFALATVAALLLVPLLAGAAGITLYYPPEWKDKAPQAKAIADTLSRDTGLEIQPRIAKTYPDILSAFSESEPVLAYAGSFVQAILFARGLSVPIAHAVDGKEFYSGVLIAPAGAGSDPVAIVKQAGSAIAFAKGASSGESAAKAASGGQAEVATNNHTASVNAIKAGKAKAAFVKNWWWEANQGKFEGMAKFDYPGVSDHKNPDNVLSANQAVPADQVAKIKAAVVGDAAAFGVQSVAEFNPARLDPTLDLMKNAGIDPKSYSW